MFRFAVKFVLVIALAAACAAGFVLNRSKDPVYTAQEWLNVMRFSRYDPLIENAGRKHGVDPMLIKAVIWRESSFHPDMVGKDGERGLMQVTVPAAEDWVKAKKIETFVPRDLFDPKTNIEVGTWYLKQSLQRWSSKEDPLPFALAEYNAGRRRVEKWIEDSNMGDKATADDLRQSISFPSTRNYIEAIVARYHFYKTRGRL